jgi:hypothetical protein
MELFIHGFIPGLVLILFAVAISFFAIPTIAPAVLFTGSFVLLAIAVFFHWDQFGTSEYERSTVRWNIKDHAITVLLATIIVGCLIFYAMNKAASSGVALPAGVGGFFGESDLPPLSVPTFGGGLNEIAMTAGSRISALMRKGRLNL